jgi:vanillate O-demethylase ferredoxin subunit
MFSAQFSPLRISALDMLTPDVMRLRLQHPQGKLLPPFEAGAHIQIQINEQHCRAYSLCSNPADLSHYDVAVKREALGRGGSQALHALARPGVELPASAPRNLFSLAPNAEHHLLVGGGVGLTPLMAMAHQLATQGLPFSFVVAVSSAGSSPFGAQLAASGWPVELVHNPREALDMTRLLAALPAQTHVYCCGPQGLMSRVREQCAGLPAEQWHEEAFVCSETSVQTGFQLHLSDSGLDIDVPAGSSMLAALRQAGVALETNCEQGICGSCVVAWSDGEPLHGDQCLDDEDRSEYIAVCCGSCRSPRMTLAL